MVFELGGRNDVEEATQAREVRREAAPSRCADRSKYDRGGGNPGDRRERGDLRDELLDGEIFYSLREAQILIESWRRHYNTVRPHGALGYRPPAKRHVEQRPTMR
jgi:transposase InsO family protein